MIRKIANFFSRKGKKDEKPAASSSNGFFSTSLPVLRKPLSDIDKMTVLSKSLQKTIADYSIDKQAADSAVAIAQDSSNKMTMHGLQAGIPDIQLMWYASQGFIGYQACAILAQNWLIDKACSAPAEDAIRNGYTVTINNGDSVDPRIIDEFKLKDKQYKVKENLVEFVHFCRVFGIRHMLFVVNSADPDYYEKPFNPDGVTPGSYKGMSQIDPYWITPEFDAGSASDPVSQNFYEPTYWRISGKRYHKSHFVIIRNREVADVLKPSYIYGGIPLTQMIYERVYAAERCANESPQLLLSKRTTAIHTDIKEALANQIAFDARMELWQQYRDNFAVKLLGLKETMEQIDTSLTDLDETIMTQYQLVSAIAKVPSTKLLGTTPKGFNATGEYDEDNYHEELESIQSKFMEPVLERHHMLVMRSHMVRKFKMSPLNTNIKWEPLDIPSAKEQAEINQSKAATGRLLVESGAIDGIDERNRIANDQYSGYTNIPEIDIEIPDGTDKTEEETAPVDEEQRAMG